MIWLWLVPAVLFAAVLIMAGILVNDWRRARHCKHKRLTIHRNGDRVCQRCRFDLGNRL